MLTVYYMDSGRNVYKIRSARDALSGRKPSSYTTSYSIRWAVRQSSARLRCFFTLGKVWLTFIDFILWIMFHCQYFIILEETPHAVVARGSFSGYTRRISVYFRPSNFYSENNLLLLLLLFFLATIVKTGY